jgi:hypothetical protein
MRSENFINGESSSRRSSSETRKAKTKIIMKILRRSSVLVCKLQRQYSEKMASETEGGDGNGNWRRRRKKSCSAGNRAKISRALLGNVLCPVEGLIEKYTKAVGC